MSHALALAILLVLQAPKKDAPKAEAKPKKAAATGEEETGGDDETGGDGNTNNTLCLRWFLNRPLLYCCADTDKKKARGPFRRFFYRGIEVHKLLDLSHAGMRSRQAKSEG